MPRQESDMNPDIITSKIETEKTLDNTPAFLAVGPSNIDGQETKMATFILRTKPCAYNKCAMCGFDNNASCTVKHENIVRQYENGMRSLDMQGVGILDYPTAGSFMNDAELSPESRNYLFDRAAEWPEVKRVMIETRVDYLTVEKVRELQRRLRPDQQLELAIGLESANDRIRNAVLHKGLSRKGFEHFADICRETSSRLRAYMLIGSPTLTEAQMIEDAVETARYVYQVTNERGVNAFLALKPTFIPAHTELEEQFEKGEYRLPTLWSVIETIKRITQLEGFQPNSLWTGMYDENLSSDRFAHNCGKCDKMVAEAIVRFNATQDPKGFDGLTCECKDTWQHEIDS